MPKGLKFLSSKQIDALPEIVSPSEIFTLLRRKVDILAMLDATRRGGSR